MAGLVPAIHEPAEGRIAWAATKTWMAGTSPAMTEKARIGRREAITGSG